jgi:hypothetical protein
MIFLSQRAATQLFFRGISRAQDPAFIYDKALISATSQSIQPENNKSIPTLQISMNFLVSDSLYCSTVGSSCAEQAQVPGPYKCGSWIRPRNESLCNKPPVVGGGPRRSRICNPQRHQPGPHPSANNTHLASHRSRELRAMSPTC